VYFGGQFATFFLPDIVKWLPFSAGNAVLAQTGPGGGAGGDAFAALEPNLALLVVAAWLVGALVVAAAFTERAEIAG
jgi:hypothetical protein